MNPLRTPKAKFLAACALILVLALLAPAHGISPAAIARLLLGGIALAGLAWWASRKGPQTPKFALAPRLSVTARTGLSQRCGVALVEADGRTYLVAFGDGFANIHETASRPAARARSGRIAKPAAKKGGAR